MSHAETAMRGITIHAHAPRSVRAGRAPALASLPPRWRSPTVGAVSAQAATGGAATASGGAAPEGQDIVFSPLRVAGASWYGPGLYGSNTACGQTLRANTLGVAHRSLPCGTMVKFVYHGHALDHPGDRPRALRQRPCLGPDRSAPAKRSSFEGVGRFATRSRVEYARAGLASSSCDEPPLGRPSG